MKYHRRAELAADAQCRLYARALSRTVTRLRTLCPGGQGAGAWR